MNERRKPKFKHKQRHHHCGFVISGKIYLHKRAKSLKVEVWAEEVKDRRIHNFFYIDPPYVDYKVIIPSKNKLVKETLSNNYYFK